MDHARKKAMIISVGTGKEGKDISHGICFSIRQQNPDFVVFLSTDASNASTMPFILEDRATQGKKWKKIELKDPDDVEKITLECQEVIRSLVREGYEKGDIMIDYTSGTKAMSSGLSIAAIREKVGSLIYITGKRGEGGRVISGAERVLSLAPNQVFAEDLFNEAIEAFNSYHFDLSLKILQEARRSLSDPEFLHKIETLGTLCRAYAAWDRFEIKEAFEILAPIRGEATLARWKIQDQIELNKQALYQEKEKIFCPERAFDLLENAKRRGDEERKFDDATARLYRLCEYMAQFQLNQLGLYRLKNGRPDTSDLDLSKLPDITEKYSRYMDKSDGKVKVPLSGSYALLGDLNHPLGISFKEKEGSFKKLMGLRDRSILAHGSDPVSEGTYKDLLEFVENLIQTFDSSGERIRKRVKFPKIAHV